MKQLSSSVFASLVLGAAAYAQDFRANILGAVVDLGDLWYPVAPITEQHHLRTQGHPAHCLPAHLLQLPALVIRQVHPYHPHTLPMSCHRRSMPKL